MSSGFFWIMAWLEISKPYDIPNHWVPRELNKSSHFCLKINFPSIRLQTPNSYEFHSGICFEKMNFVFITFYSQQIWSKLFLWYESRYGFLFWVIVNSNLITILSFCVKHWKINGKMFFIRKICGKFLNIRISLTKNLYQNWSHFYFWFCA